MGLYIEETLLDAVKGLLVGRVNELLREEAFMIPPIEFTHREYGGYYATTPELAVCSCERSEKDRIVQLDAYTLTITFSEPEEYGERNCYTYAGAVERALREDPTLGGAADRAALARKEYRRPKHWGSGEEWGLTLTLRVTVENR
jgi:hypothetical protein